VPIELVGEAPAVKALGALLNRTMSEIEVEALPAELPQKFTIDLSTLAEIGQSVYVKDLVLPKGVKIDIDPETVIVSVAEPAPEEVVAPVATVADVKVESEEKKAEREQAKAQSEEK
jgi:large subunit ribosomal protein L25